MEKNGFLEQKLAIIHIDWFVIVWNLLRRKDFFFNFEEKTKNRRTLLWFNDQSLEKYEVNICMYIDLMIEIRFKPKWIY